MKQLKLLLLLCIGCQGLYAQNPLDLRGVRYYYSSPTLGNLTNSLVGFKPLYVEEKNDFYYLSGYAGLMAATIVKIDKYTNTPLWDYCETNDSQSVGFSLDENGNILMTYHVLCNFSCQDDSIRSVQFNSNGQSTVKKHKSDNLLRIWSYNKLRTNENIATGHKDFGSITGVSPSSWPYCYPFVMRMNDNGDIIDSLMLPIYNVYQDLPVEYGRGVKSFKYKHDNITFGNLLREISIDNDSKIFYPTFWIWNNDSVLQSRDVFLNFPGHNEGMDFGGLRKIDGVNNEFAFSATRPNNSTLPNPAYVTYIDSNLIVAWDKKIGNLPDATYAYNIEDVKIDSINGFVYVVGKVNNTNNNDDLLFVSKYRRNGTLVFNKHFIIDESSDNKIHSMSILEDGDLLFAGRSYKDGITSFFTYRTGPDGYDPAGQYLGLEVVTASPTEIDIFPNPSDGIFQVSSLSEEPMLITMLDQQGKQVAVFELNKLSSDNSFDMSEQATGVYFTHISQGEQQWVKKLVVR